MNRELYRYISFEDFVNLVINNKERYVRPSSWDDKFEGYLFSFIETPEDVRNIVKEMYYNLCPGNYYAIPNNYFKLWHSKWFVYAQCWSEYSETDAMWRSYSYGNRSIRIRTKETKLLNHAKKIFPESEQFKVYLEEVHYDLGEKSVVEQQIAQTKESSLIYEAYFHKRSVFMHEGEYRLLIADNRLYDAEKLSSQSVKFEIGEQVKSKTDEGIIDYLTEKICEQRADWDRIKDNDVRIEKTENIPEFLDGVMVHPLAPKWYVDIIRDLCEEKEIKFDGQSEIYKLK